MDTATLAVFVIRTIEHPAAAECPAQSIPVPDMPRRDPVKQPILAPGDQSSME